MKYASIVVPAYNAAKFLAETIDSVINQSFSDWELIIVNDGSTDTTQTIIDAYCQKDKRIFGIKIKNQGVSNARNEGLKIARGKYIAFLDADDLWAEACLEKKIMVLEKNPDIGLMHAQMQVINENSVLQENILSGKSGHLLDSLLSWDGTNIPGPSSILMRTNLAKEVGGFSPELSTAADQEFFFRVASKAIIGKIDEVLGYYRVHNQNMHQNIKLMQTDHIKAYKLANKNNLFKNYWFKKKCFSNLYLILAGSWWKDGNSKIKALQFIFKSIIIYPANIVELFSKLK